MDPSLSSRDTSCLKNHSRLLEAHWLNSFTHVRAYVRACVAAEHREVREIMGSSK